MQDSILNSNNLLKYLSEQVYYFVVISFLVSIIISAIFQSLYDIFLRAFLQKKLVKTWISKLVIKSNSRNINSLNTESEDNTRFDCKTCFRELNQLLGETKDESRLNILYSLSYTELCGLISNSFSNAMRLKVNIKEKYENLFNLLIKDNLYNNTANSIEESNIQLSIIFEKNIDELQSYLKSRLLRYEYSFCFFFAILIIASLAIFPNINDIEKMLTFSPGSDDDNNREILISAINSNFYLVYLSILSSGSIAPVIRNILQRFLSFK